MASDEHRSPWFPVEPEGEPVDDTSARADTPREAVPAATPTTAPPAAVPSFDDVLAPEQAPRAGAFEGVRPFELTPSRPSMTRPATTPIPTVTAQDPAWQDPTWQDPSPQDSASQDSSPQPPALSPYLNVERRSAPRVTYEPPVAGAFQPGPAAPTSIQAEAPAPVQDAYQAPSPAPVQDAYQAPSPAPVQDAYQAPAPVQDAYQAPTAPIAEQPTPAPAANPYSQPSAAPAPPYDTDEAWRPDRRAGFPSTGPIATGPIMSPPTAVEPIEQPSSAAWETPKLELQPPITYAPWTGAIPQVEIPVPAIDPIATAAPEPEPELIPTPEPTITPPSWQEHFTAHDPDAPVLVRGLFPTPIEAEEADIVAPVLPPDAAEIQPRGADPLRAFAPPETPEAQTYAESQDSPQEYVPDVADPVRQLGASALSTASLEAAGAPTPRGGIPLMGVDGDVVPSFGDEEPFVPRFEPFGSALPAVVPTVSFTTPMPTTRPVSPLSDVAVPESDEPAYAPREEFLDIQPPSPSAREDADAATAEPSAPPARPWAAVDPTEVEFVGGEPLSVEVGAFGAEAPDAVEGLDGDAPVSTFSPTAPSWEGIMSGGAGTALNPPSYEAPVTVGSGRFPPVVDVPADPALPEPVDFEAEPVDFKAEAAETPPAAAATGDDSFAPHPAGPSTETLAEAAPSEAAPGEPAPSEAAPGEPAPSEAAPSEAAPGEPAPPAFAFPAAPPTTPVTPVASFFAATAARNARRAEDASGATPMAPSFGPAPTEGSTPESDSAEATAPDLEPAEASAPEWVSAEATAPDLEPAEASVPEWMSAEAIAPQSQPAEAFRAAPIPAEPLRSEPVHTTATAYTQSTGVWASPAFASASADAVTQVDGIARVGDTTEMNATDAMAPTDTPTETTSTDENPEAGVKIGKTHKRRRLVLWIVLGALVAGAAAVLVYRLYFMPDPIILPAPIATAQAATPTAKPLAITDSSTFVAAMPTTVGTDVLINYTVTDTIGDSTLPARAAEKVTLDYGPGSSSKVFTVEAYQHYDQTAAQTAYDSYAAGMTDVKDVVVDGTTVGKRAFSTSGSNGTVVWRNGTAVFDLTGPAGDVLGFFEHFGV